MLLRLVYLVPLLLAGCDSTTSPDEYVAHSFFLEDAELPPSSGVTELTPSTITFGPDEELAIESCNTCGGTYAWDGNLLHVRDLVCTEIACGASLDLGEWLGAAERIVVSDTDDALVTLVAERDGQLATFSFRVAATD